MPSNFEILGKFKAEKEAIGHQPRTIGDDVRVLMGTLEEELHISDARVYSRGNDGVTFTVITSDDKAFDVHESRVILKPTGK